MRKGGGNEIKSMTQKAITRRSQKKNMIREMRRATKMRGMMWEDVEGAMQDRKKWREVWRRLTRVNLIRVL